MHHGDSVIQNPYGHLILQARYGRQLLQTTTALSPCAPKGAQMFGFLIYIDQNTEQNK